MYRAACVAVNMTDTLYVCYGCEDSVCLVSVSRDTVIRRLSTLEVYRFVFSLPVNATHVSVLGETVLACYTRCRHYALAIYYGDSLGQALDPPKGLEKVSKITADSRSSSFLVTGSSAVFVLDDKLLWHRACRTDTGIRVLYDCAAVQSHQLWLGYSNGDIDILARPIPTVTEVNQSSHTVGVSNIHWSTHTVTVYIICVYIHFGSYIM